MACEKATTTSANEPLAAKPESALSAWLTTRSEHGALARLAATCELRPLLGVQPLARVWG